MSGLTWSKKIPFFKNTYLLKSVLLAYIIVIVVFSIIIITIFIASGDGDKLKEVILPFLGVFLFLFLLFLLGTWITIGNKYEIQYTLSNEGITIKSLKDKAKNIRKLAIAAGILSVNPGLLGAGLLVKDDIIKISWNEIEQLKWQTNPQKLIINCSIFKQVAIHYPIQKHAEIHEIVTNNYM